MIKIKSQSLAMHSHNVPGYKYQMNTTWTIPATANPSQIVDWIIYAADHSPEMVLSSVVINTHGSPGYLHIGSGIGVEHVSLFRKLKTKSIGYIWIVACEVSKGKDMGNVCPVDSTNGPYFCSELAKASGCHVIAADALQSVGFFSEVALRVLPMGYIDEYEGNAYRYSPAGGRKMLNSSASDAYD